MYTFGVCSLWHLAAVSVVKCTVIVRPLTHFTIFTDRVLRVIICTMWILSVVVCGTVNIDGTEVHFTWIRMVTERQITVFVRAFAATLFVVATLIIMIAYIKVFLVVRRQVRSMRTAGSTTIFSSSVRSAKNLFVMCAVFCFTFAFR